MATSSNTTPSFVGTVHIDGHATGKLITSDLELSFWGGIDPYTGEVIDHHHPLSGQTIRDCILVIPGGRGSCTGSQVVLELLLNGNGPSAMVFARREEILTLGVMVAEEIFANSIPVLTLDSTDFQKVLQYDGHEARVISDRISILGSADAPSFPHQEPLGIPMSPSHDNMTLSSTDKQYLSGEHGEAVAASMRIILRMAELMGASELMDVTQVHVDGCIYTGPASLAFVERLRDLGGNVRVPTTLNSISIDRDRWRKQGVPLSIGHDAEALSNAYLELGASPTYTCAPYQLATAPRFGEQVAWAESNAVVYANSVLGARTMKYPDLLDVCIALTGRAPKAGPHLDANRLAQICIQAPCPSTSTIDDAYYPILGYAVGRIATSQIPVVAGIESLNPSTDDLKAFGAAFATLSGAPLFHIVGITPEATTLECVLAKGPHVRHVDIDSKDLLRSWDTLNSAPPNRPVDLVSLGNPHFSLKEIRSLEALCKGHKRLEAVRVIVTCGRATYGLADQAGLVRSLGEFGVEFLTDTCWCMITEPIIPSQARIIVTNSAKYAHYGPGLTKKNLRFASLAGCVEAACTGFSRGQPQWLAEQGA